MPAFSGDPWRGAAKIRRTALVGGAYTEAYVAAEQTNPTGDLATWEGVPGGALTLNFQWGNNGAGSGQAPTFATVELRLPGGAAVGSAWSVPFPAANTWVTRTMHFDDDPLSAVLSAALRAGTLEMYLNFGSTGGVAPWNVDSRGASSGTGTDTVNWSRGKLRSRNRLLTALFSDVSLGGAEPASFAATNPLYSRFTFSQWYEPSITHQCGLLRGAGSAVERQQSISLSGGTADFSWTGSTGSPIGRISPSGMAAVSETKAIVFETFTTSFGGDNVRVWDTTGHPAGWIRDSDTQLRYPNRLAVDPRLHARHFFMVDRTSFDLDYDDVTKQFLVSQTGQCATRVMNARNEGLNGLGYTQTADPANTGSTVTESGTTSTRDSEAGWTALVDVCPTGKPGGLWAKAIDITSPADLTSDAAFTNPSENIVVIADDPRLVLRCEGGNPYNREDHWRPGMPYVVGMSAGRFEGAAGVEVLRRVAYDADSAVFALFSFKPELGRVESLASDGLTWEFTDTPYLWRASLSPGDSKTGIYTFTNTAAWGFRGAIWPEGHAKIGGVPKSGGGRTDMSTIFPDSTTFVDAGRPSVK